MMMTVGETIDSILKKQLPEDLRAAALHAVLRMATDDSYRKRVQFIGGDVGGAFIWEKTDESFDFWNRVTNAPDRKTTIKETHHVNS